MSDTLSAPDTPVRRSRRDPAKIGLGCTLGGYPGEDRHGRGAAARARASSSDIASPSTSSASSTGYPAENRAGRHGAARARASLSMTASPSNSTASSKNRCPARSPATTPSKTLLSFRRQLLTPVKEDNEDHTLFGIDLSPEPPTLEPGAGLPVKYEGSDIDHDRLDFKSNDGAPAHPPAPSGKFPPIP